MKTKRSLLAASVAAAVLLGACSKAPEQVTTNTATPAAAEAAQSSTQVSETERLNQWFEEKYEEQLMRSPLRLTSLGRKERYSEIDDVSEQAADEQYAWLTATVEELRANFDYDKLSDDAKISYDLWIYGFDTATAARPFTRRGYVFTQMSGPQSSLPNLLINFHNVASLQDMQDYNSRITGLARAIDQLMDQTKVRAEEGWRAPYFAYDGVIEQATNLITGAPFSEDAETDSPIFADAKRKIAALLEAGTIDQAAADDLTQDAIQALTGSFWPSYQALIDWHTADRENVSEQAQGIGALPDGLDAYNIALLNSTTTNMTAEERLN